jgi:hypothetical protein
VQLSQGRWWWIVAAVVAVGVVLAALFGSRDRPDSDAAGAAPSPSVAASGSPSAEPSASTSPVYVRVGGVQTLLPNREITDPTLLPYPFMSPTPAPEVTSIDGTYLRTLTFEELGGARRSIPLRCLRCPPFRLTPGVNTLVLYRGAYYVDHHLSGFRTMGSFVVDGDRLTLFNDANCPQLRGVYEIDLSGHGIRFRAVEDECAYGNERALDLEFRPWTRVPACVVRVENLWPGEVAC